MKERGIIMSTQNERQLILEMLKDGKISVDEAQKLLEALSQTERAEAAVAEPNRPDADREDDDGARSETGRRTRVVNEPFINGEEIGRAVEATTKEAARAAREAARQVRQEMREVERELREELKLAQREAREAQKQAQREGDRLRAEAERLAAQAKEATAATAETAVRESGSFLEGLGSLFSVFERNPGFDIFGSSYRTETVQEGEFDASAMVDLPRGIYTPTEKQIRINAYTSNGRIVVRGWNEKTFRMTLNASVKASSSEEARAKLEKMLIVTQSPDMLYIDGRAFVGSNAGMSIELWLPRCYQYEMDLKGSNGRVTLEDIHAQGLEVSTSNGRMELSGVTAKVAKLKSSNGSIICDTGIPLLTAHSSNGSVRLRTSSEAANTYDIVTSNGSIKIQVDDCENLAHDLDLRTSGKIVVNLPGAIGGFSESRSTRLESLTSGFEQYGKRLRVSARTSNGSIRISDSEEI